MTPVIPAQTCRRRLMLAAVAATVLMLTTPQTARAEDTAAPQAMADQLTAGKDAKDAKSLPPVSEADLAKAKAEVEKMRAMSQDERVDYLVKKRESAGPGDFATHKVDMQARKAYIQSLPDAERATLREQMKADRKIVKEKMKAKWDAMTPAERDAIKAKRKAEFDKLPDDVKAKMKDKRDHYKDKGHKKGDHGDKAFGKKDPADTPAAPSAE